MKLFECEGCYHCKYDVHWCDYPYMGHFCDDCQVENIEMMLAEKHSELRPSGKEKEN